MLRSALLADGTTVALIHSLVSVRIVCLSVTYILWQNGASYRKYYH